MATIQPSGNFPNQPLTGGSKSRESHKPEQALGFPVEDGLTLSGIQLPPGVPTPGPALLPGPKLPINLPLELPSPEQFNATMTYDPETGAMNYFLPNWDEKAGQTFDIISYEERRRPSEFEGALMSGPGVASGIAALHDIGAPTAGGKYDFTNGLYSTKLTGINGNVLADWNYITNPDGYGKK